MISILHFSFSFLISFIIFLSSFSKMEAFVLSILVGFLSMLPDLDVKIYIWANKKKIILDKNKMLKYLLLPYYLMLLFLVNIFKHRTTTHNIFVPLFVFLLIFVTKSSLLRLFLFLLSLAMFLHIVGDMLTVSGVPIFYPLSKKTFGIPLINTFKHKKLQYFLSAVLILTSITLYILY